MMSDKTGITGYGAADTVCAVAELSKADILAAMR